jgi:hypothetical protein
MDNVQNCDNHINIALSQTYRSNLRVLTLNEMKHYVIYSSLLTMQSLLSDQIIFIYPLTVSNRHKFDHLKALCEEFNGYR